MQPSDEQLVLACQRGDEMAWEQLIARYKRLIYAIPRRAGLVGGVKGGRCHATCFHLDAKELWPGFSVLCEHLFNRNYFIACGNRANMPLWRACAGASYGDEILPVGRFHMTCGAQQACICTMYLPAYVGTARGYLRKLKVGDLVGDQDVAHADTCRANTASDPNKQNIARLPAMDCIVCGRCRLDTAHVDQ